MNTKVEERLTEDIYKGMYSESSGFIVIPRHDLKGWGPEKEADSFTLLVNHLFDSFYVQSFHNDGFSGAMWSGLYKSEWARLCCSNKQLHNLSGLKQPRFISQSCWSIRGHLEPLPHDLSFGPRMIDQPQSQTVLVITAGERILGGFHVST